MVNNQNIHRKRLNANAEKLLDICWIKTMHIFLSIQISALLTSTVNYITIIIGENKINF